MILRGRPLASNGWHRPAPGLQSDVAGITACKTNVVIDLEFEGPSTTISQRQPARCQQDGTGQGSQVQIDQNADGSAFRKGARRARAEEKALPRNAIAEQCRLVLLQIAKRSAHELPEKQGNGRGLFDRIV